ALDVAIETGNEHTQVFALDGVATCAVSSDPTEAVRLAAAAATLRDAHGGGWSLEAMGVESARTAAAAAFTPAEIERAWRDGSQMSLEEAIDLGRRLLAGSS
ncbi:MAG: hypothetical protein U9O18_02160, partial [Chloroflexota bacterium]|nr:hypothetical protein [Chloroflexota bacterium]